MMMIGIGIPITQSNNERMGHSLECEGQMRRCAKGSSDGVRSAFSPVDTLQTITGSPEGIRPSSRWNPSETLR